MDVKKLIEEVLMALGDNKSLNEVSSKIQIIVRLLGDDKLRSWYNCEFVKGYYNDENIPDYRVSRAADIKADYFTHQGLGLLSIPNQSVPVHSLGKEKYDSIMSIEIKDTISSIIEYSKHPNQMAMSLSPYEKSLVQKILGYAQIQSVHKIVPPSVFQTIIDNVQNRIIDMFMDLNDKVFNGELDITSSQGKKEMQQVINNYITAGVVQTGSGTIDASNSTNASRVEQPLSAETISKLTLLANEVEKFAKDYDGELDNIAQEIMEIRAELSKLQPSSSLLKKSFKALTWGTTISCKTAIEEVVKKALELLS